MESAAAEWRVSRLDDVAVMSPARPEELVALDDALQRLERQDPRKSTVVELRYFGGLTVEEIAELLSVAPITVKRDWAMAKAWLHREMSHASATADTTLRSGAGRRDRA